MSLSDLAALGSFMSGVAVVVTLIFLILQMRQANRYQRSSMQLGRATRFSNLILKATDPEVARVMVKATSCAEPLDEVEMRIFFGMVFADFWNWEDTFLQYRAGLLPSESMASDEARMRAVLLQPSYRAMWHLISVSYCDEFRAYVDGIAKQLAPLPLGELGPIYKKLVDEQMAQAKLPLPDAMDHRAALDAFRDAMTPGSRHQSAN